jgi:hypothetical protein
MDKLPEFPPKPIALLRWPDDVHYERARADAWEARCRLAVEALRALRDPDLSLVGLGICAGEISSRALQAIGPLPMQAQP